jgi:hypothetical protein
MTQKRSSREGINVRLPEGMRDRIKISAVANKRTMNNEVVFRLERDFNQEAKGPAGASTPPSHGSNNSPEGRDDEHART